METRYNVMKKVRDLIAGERQLLAYTCVHGCAQNEADMENIRGMLREMGYGFTENPENADVIVVNTCAVREGAEFKIYGNVGSFKKIKEKNPDLVIVLCGCMMQQESVVEKIKHSYPYVDIVFGTFNIADFPLMLYKKLTGKKRVFEIMQEGKIIEGMPTLRENKFSASVSVMSGCNNFCSYCIVPYTRGRERSREFDAIINEIKDLAKEGYVEITLIGQNVNSYGKDLADKPTFAKLLRAVNEIEGIKRIRFVTSHPKDLSDELILAMAECENVCKQLHLPFQAGSNKILKLMNRKYTKEQYLALVEKIKAAIPDISLTTDVIVGFPGETTEDFEDTMDVLHKVKYDGVYSFIYSRRGGTPAAKMEDVISEEEKHKNLERLLEEQKEIGYQNNLKYMDNVYEVLVEGKSKSNDNMMSGRTESGKIIHFEGDESLIGKFVNIKITKIKTYYMVGERV
ncbi:MAG: tRNA (N6-isopentenyl adenosine(37)-C2)-methylthiotransferase MiaB [Clostridia bacterium]|nr:tRNA (N6-isopentenyl adenosine(37)-C2)-methylthiotransferase MiaB [Clostridia bacterium]MBR3575873.1 tRNA (N6-isopentenyl adenosine(37)-C2)-methylthiotransferase MiaB [Clostridia bacterium]